MIVDVNRKIAYGMKRTWKQYDTHVKIHDINKVINIYFDSYGSERDFTISWDDIVIYYVLFFFNPLRSRKTLFLIILMEHIAHMKSSAGFAFMWKIFSSITIKVSNLIITSILIILLEFMNIPLHTSRYEFMSFQGVALSMWLPCEYFMDSLGHAWMRGWGEILWTVDELPNTA